MPRPPPSGPPDEPMSPAQWDAKMHPSDEPSVPPPPSLLPLWVPPHHYGEIPAPPVRGGQTVRRDEESDAPSHSQVNAIKLIQQALETRRTAASHAGAPPAETLGDTDMPEGSSVPSAETTNTGTQVNPEPRSGRSGGNARPEAYGPIRSGRSSGSGGNAQPSPITARSRDRRGGRSGQTGGRAPTQPNPLEEAAVSASAASSVPAAPQSPTLTRPADSEEGRGPGGEEKRQRTLLTWQEELALIAADEGQSRAETHVDYLYAMAFHTEDPVVQYEIQAETPLYDVVREPIVEIGFSGLATRAHTGAGCLAASDEVVVTSYNSTTDTQSSIIVKDFDILTPAELHKHQPKVYAAKLKEITNLQALGCFTRMPLSAARNRVDVKWVLKWKLVEAERIIKARMTMRGFKDRVYELDTFAGTATRWAQRLVNSGAALNPGYKLFSFDVSTAFAKGMTFKELSSLTGQPLRAVQFDLPAEDVAILRTIPGFEDFNPHLETLSMVKPIYGLKDAPRAWRKKLDIILRSFGCKPLYADAQVYVKHSKSLAETPGRLRVETPSRAETPQPKLELILSTHVDDLKGAASKAVALALLAHIETEVGKCTQEWTAFTHTGIEHKLTPDGVCCNQAAYAQQLRPLEASLWSGLEPESLAPPPLIALYQSLLGGVAWMVLTRPDVAVYVQSLQRHAATPRIIDLKRLNVVVRFIKAKVVDIWYPRLKGPVKLMAFSDAAFKTLPEESSGLALRGCCVLLVQDTGSFAKGPCHLLEWICRRQRRVVRSTFSAELNGLIDTVEVTLLVQMGVHELICGAGATSSQLAKRLEVGTLQPPVDAGVDAKSVFDAIDATDVADLQECSLKLHVLSIRDKLMYGVLRDLWWVDTRDMLADGLTKGGIDRAALVAAAGGTYTAVQEPQRARTTRAGGNASPPSPGDSGGNALE